MRKLLLRRITAAALMLLLFGVTACRGNKTTGTPEPTTAVTDALSGEQTPDIGDDGSATPSEEAVPTTGDAGTDTPSTAEQGDNNNGTPQNAAAPGDNTTFLSTGEAKVTIDGTKFIVNGKELWVNGVNTPWDAWNDFGGSSFNAKFWDTHFEKLAQAGVNASRIWINCNGMVGVKLNPDGSFLEATDKHWQDLDTLFQIAEKHKIYIMATLLSFDHFKGADTSALSWRAMITSDDNIDSFIEGYVIPFAKRYDDCDYLWSIDLMNEPDWVHENAECGQIGWEHISNLFARASAGIHENSDVLVTVGMGMIKYNSDLYEGNVVSDVYLQNLTNNPNSYLDFYSTHYYFWQRPWFSFPFDRSAVDFKLDGTKPSVIGEVPSLDESGWTITEKYEGTYNNGWNGIMTWTSNGVDACGGYNDVEPAVKRMYELIPELIRPLDYE